MKLSSGLPQAKKSSAKGDVHIHLGKSEDKTSVYARYNIISLLLERPIESGNKPVRIGVTDVRGQTRVLFLHRYFRYFTIEIVANRAPK